MMNDGKQLVLFTHISMAKDLSKKLFLLTASGYITGEYDQEALNNFSSLPIDMTKLEERVIPLKNVSIQQAGATGEVITNSLFVYSDQIIASSLIG